MSPAETRQCVENVLGGLTAQGNPCALRRLSFPKDDVAMRVFSSKVGMLLLSLACIRGPTDEETTAIIRKFVVFAVRTGIATSLHAHEWDGVFLAPYLADNRHLITSRMGYARMVELAMAAAKERERQRAAKLLAMSRKPLPYCPPRLVWRSDDAAFDLSELVHPQHVRDAGAAFGNCLSSQYVPGFESLKLRKGTAAALPFLSYWQRIMQGKLRLFVLSDATKPSAVFVIQGGALREIEFRRGVEPPLDALAAALARLHETHGVTIGRVYQCHRFGPPIENLVERLYSAAPALLGALTAASDDHNVRPRRMTP